MATLLYKDFLENAASYDAAEAMWKDFFDALAEKNGLVYSPYINVLLPNGEKERDANPIFSALVNAQNRGVRIIQYPVEDAQELYISGWLDTFDLYEDQPPIEELVIDLVLSEEMKAIAEKWIEVWLVDRLDKEQLERYIQEQMVLVD